MPFTPTSISWPGTRAVLLVHGIGRASAAGDAAFPLESLKRALGAHGEDVAVYTFNYDFINDWLVRKTGLADGIRQLKNVLRVKMGNDEAAGTIADYAGDVLWPVLSADLRLAIRDAFIAQLIQIHLDCGVSALERGDDPLDYQTSIVAHSLGCFHTYETLWATALEPTHRLRPASNLFQLQSVWLMASPVQLIRSVAADIRPIVPDIDTLSCVARPLGIPCEAMGTRNTMCTDRFIAVTGSQDPVGGHILGRKQDWAYMNLGGQQTVIQPQHLTNVSDRASLAAALRVAATGAGANGIAVEDPHSWTRYIENEAGRLREVILT